MLARLRFRGFTLVELLVVLALLLPADGSVHPVAWEVDAAFCMRLITREGGEPANEFFAR